MKTFDFKTAINQLGLVKCPINSIDFRAVPSWVKGSDFIDIFLPHLIIVGDSREQDRWIGDYCKMVGIKIIWTSAKNGIENLKEGDYAYGVKFGNKAYNYIGKVAYERKGKLSEFYSNCTGYKKETKTSDRDRIKRELNRFNEKNYKKVVFLLQFGNRFLDLINAEFSFSQGGVKKTINVGNVVFSSIMSWRQPNSRNFDILQSEDKAELFWLMLYDMYYYFRNEIKQECIKNNLIGEKE